MFRAHVAPGEEGENYGEISVDADAHDEENAAIEVAAEEEAFDFTCSISKAPLLLIGIVNDEQRQGQDIKNVTDGQVTGEHYSGVPVLPLFGHQEPQGKYIPYQSHTHLNAIHWGEESDLKRSIAERTAVHCPWCSRTPEKYKQELVASILNHILEKTCESKMMM